MFGELWSLLLFHPRRGNPSASCLYLLAALLGSSWLHLGKPVATPGPYPTLLGRICAQHCIHPSGLTYISVNPGCKSNIYKSRFQTGYKFVQRNRWLGVAVCQLGYLYGEEEGAWHTVGRGRGTGGGALSGLCWPQHAAASLAPRARMQVVTLDGSPGGQPSPQPPAPVKERQLGQNLRPLGLERL